jgi:hypothetical protein
LAEVSRLGPALDLMGNQRAEHLVIVDVDKRGRMNGGDG